MSADSRVVFTDASGRRYEVIEWRYVKGKRKRLTTTRESQGRAFIPLDGSGEVLIYEYELHLDYRDTDPKTLARQLARAIPPGSTHLEWMRQQGHDV